MFYPCSDRSKGGRGLLKRARGTGMARRGQERGQAAFYCYGAQPLKPVTPTTPRLTLSRPASLSFSFFLSLSASPSFSLIRYSSWSYGACSVHKMPPTMIPINRGTHARAELSNQDRFDDGGQKFGINSMRDAAVS